MAITKGAVLYGVNRLFDKLDKEHKDKQKRMQKALRDASLLVIAEIQKKMTASTGGRKYPSRGAKGKIHIASLPGNAPAKDIGELRGSLKYDLKKIHAAILSEVGVMGKTMATRASYLEYGTSKMKARPFLFTTVQELRPRIKAIFKKYCVYQGRR